MRHCHIFYSEATIYCYMEFSTISGKQKNFFFYNFFGFGSISNFSNPSIFIAICTTGLTLMLRTRKKKRLRDSRWIYIAIYDILLQYATYCCNIQYIVAIYNILQYIGNILRYINILQYIAICTTYILQLQLLQYIRAAYCNIIYCLARERLQYTGNIRFPTSA